MKKKYKARAGRTLLCLVLALFLISAELTPVLAVTQKEIDNLKGDASDLKEERKELENELKALENDRAQVVKKKGILDQQISNTSQQIQNVEEQISKYTELIAQAEAELADAETKEDEQYKLFCQRIRAMEEQGTVNYWAFLFGAASFSDLLGRLDIVNEIMDYDKRVMEDLKNIRLKLAAEKETLKSAKAEQVTAKAELEEKKAELQTELDQANALMQKIRSDEKTYKDTLDAIDKEEEEIQAKIVELSKQNNQSGQNATTAVNGYTMAQGGYMWPTPSHRVTSPFGPRKSPGGIGSTNHKGIDIGSVWYSTEIVASKAGTVIISQYSNSYGNYVVVSHGSGNTTLYAHMSKRLVSVGQSVKQGQVLGISGSTGNSTGPHLHFEITEGGVRKDPLKYLTDYQKSW